MEREIKFRAKLKVKLGELPIGSWVYFTLKEPYYNGLIDWDTLGQFTGKLDSNLKDIYSDDILKTCDGICLVIWNKQFASFSLSRNRWLFDHFFGEALESEESDVIGNRFDNHELLLN